MKCICIKDYRTHPDEEIVFHKGDEYETLFDELYIRVFIDNINSYSFSYYEKEQSLFYGHFNEFFITKKELRLRKLEKLKELF